MKYPIPEKALQQNIIVLGKTGAGKSSSGRTIVECMLDDHMPICIIDPKGDWWGIKLSADGKRPGYPLVIFGGKHADVPITDRAGAQVAELFATGNRPCLIDLRGWMPAERARFFVDFAAALYKHNVGRKWVLLDECHNFAPKGRVLDVEAGKCLHWANKLASEGRGLGVNLIGLSQRPQKVHNDFLTSCETLIALRVLHASDREAYRDWIDGCGDPAKGKQMLATIANLKRGTGYVWSPEIEFGPELVTFPMFRTYDSFKPQEASDAAKLTGWAEVDLDDVKQRLQAVVFEHAANDPAELKKRVKELEKQLAAKPAPGASPEELEAAERRGMQAGIQAGMCRAFTEIEAVAERMTLALPPIDARPENPVRRVEPAARAARLPDPAPTVARARQIDGRASSRSNGTGEPLPKGEATILRVLIQFPTGLRREQITVLTTFARSTRDRYLQYLKQKGLVQDGDRIVATEAGRDAMPDAEPLPTGAELRDHWLRELPTGERRILEVLIEDFPKAVARDDLSERTGFARSTRDRYLQYMANKQIVDATREGVRASEDLFS